MGKPSRPKPLPVYLTLRKMIDPATGRERAAWVAASDSDALLMQERGFKLNTRVRADLRQPRNALFNRLVHGLGRVLTQNLERFAGLQSHAAIKRLQMESGVYCDEERAELVGIGELIIKRPQSLSFDSMSEEVFQDFWQQCCAYLVATDWPTLTEERLTQMADFEAFQEAA